MTKRLLIVPAAGRGTRLGFDQPKFMYPLAGRPLIDHVLAIYAEHMDEVVVVVAPEAKELAEQHLQTAIVPVTVVCQDSPTGMLDAILCANERVAEMAPARIWVTWCDQVAVSTETVKRILETEQSAPDMVVPIVKKSSPYIHFPVDSEGRVSGVLQRREGDVMPEIGNNDMGLFSLSFSAFHLLDTQFSREPDIGQGTGERNFLPFIPWLSQQGQVTLVEAYSELETLGVNTIQDAEYIISNWEKQAGLSYGEVCE